MSYTKKPKPINPDELDPSVYYYDEVYDDMKDQEKVERRCTSNSETKNRDSKYIKGLIKTAELRKTEKELRKFKKYSRDREEAEAQGNKSEEVYLTSAYKKKLKEMKTLEEKKKRQLEKEKDNSMNFLKQTEVHFESFNNITSCTEATEVKHISCALPNSGESDNASTSQNTTSEDQGDSKSTRRPLETPEDRRSYLRKILAKRTVDRRYEEAVLRFIKRKSLLQ